MIFFLFHGIKSLKSYLVFKERIAPRFAIGKMQMYIVNEAMQRMANVE